MSPNNSSFHGIYVIDKPKSLSSQKVLNSLKTLFQTKRIGHLGTLDPFATGVLPIFVGEMTKLIPYCEDAKKSYVAELKLGEATDTLDCTGEIISREEVPPINEQLIVEAMNKLKGKRLQMPPLYSAVKIAGRPLYSYARKNQAFKVTEEMKAREVEISQLKLLSFTEDTIHFFSEVSRGTYIRTLGLEIAELLGTKGHLVNLRRTQSGFFSEEQMISPQDLNEASDEVKLQKQVSLKNLFSKVEHLEYDKETLDKMIMGQWQGSPVTTGEFKEGQIFFLYNENRVSVIAEIKLKNDRLYLAPIRALHF